MDKETLYKNKLEYNNSYNRNNYRSFSFRFNINDEADVIHWLENQEGIKSYITRLIREDMEKQNG